MKKNDFTAYLGLLKASLLSTFRNPTSVFFNFFFPFIFITIFGVLSYDNIKFEIAVYKESDTNNIFL